MRIHLFLGVILCIGLTAGCANVPLSSLYKLSKFSVLEADPGQIRIAVRGPDAIQPQKGDVRMNLGYDAEDGSFSLADVYLIEVIRGDTETPELQDGIEQNESVTLFHLSPTDAQQMRDTQRRIRQHKDKGGKGTGTLGVSVHIACLQKPVKQDSAYLDIFIQTAADEPFFNINNNLKLDEASDELARGMQEWPICDASS